MNSKGSLNHKPKVKIHPEQNANIISKLFFCWTLPMFRAGLKKELSEEDVYPILNRHEANKITNRLEEAWNKQKTTSSKPSLWKATWQVFKRDILVSITLYAFLQLVIRICKPLALGKLMGYYAFNKVEASKDGAIVYAFVIIVTTFLESVVHNYYTVLYLQIAMRQRVACSSLIYRKSLRLSKAGLGEASVGQIINLLSNDMTQLVNFWRCLNSVWASPLQAGIALYFLYTISGPTALSGLGFFLLFIPIQLYMSKIAATYRLKSALKTDERIRYMNEVISGIQVIKVYTWEQPFVKLIQLIRRQEMNLIKVVNYINTVLSSFSYFVNRTTVFLCIMTYVLTGNSPNAEYVFVVSSFYGILMNTLSMGLPLAVYDILKAQVSIRRIETFLNLEEFQNKVEHLNDVGVKIVNASAKWSKDLHSNTLQDINFEVYPKQTVAIVGSVGSGKSSLLQLCLGEIPIVDGYVQIGRKISYASQEPWLFAGTVKQNILFGQSMVREKYEEVIKVCALEDDINRFPYGDNTIVGERGILLSGGQKARINLARALYREADIYLLDDPLSAVDTKVGKQIFNNCINSYLKEKCTVLVTHQIQYLNMVDKVYLLSEGQVVAAGTYKDLQHSEADLGKLLKDNEAVEKAEEECLDKNFKIKEHSKQNEAEEARASGKVNRKVYTTYVYAFGSCFSCFLVSILLISTEICATGSDYFITFWVNLEQKKMMANTTATEIENASTNTIEIFFLSEKTCIYFYLTLIGVLIMVTVLRSWTFIKGTVRASVRLHNKMFSSVINATMSFFYTNSSGRVLNRFSKDIGSIDQEILDVTLKLVEIILETLATILAICVLNPLSILPTLVIFFIMYFIRKAYLASSLPIKRMESTYNSPIFAHLTESIKGLTTIRAFGANQILQKEFEIYQNAHSSVHYMSITANRALGAWLDSICVLYLTAVTIFALTKETYGGNIGFVITRAMGLAFFFQWIIRLWSLMETQMTSVERVIEYSQLEREKNTSSKTPSPLWPELGQIEFRSVYLQYSSQAPYVLKNINFVIKSKEKIGIVGRTGAGKSSLIPVLFRLADFEGNVFIDKVDTKEILLSSLRSKISIIPQDPVLFSGTVRKNLDPFDQYKDDAIWRVLEEVRLKEFITNLPSSLFSKLSEGGSNLSVGQKQLLCLARALLKNNKILILDEATANVDLQTDELLQETIRKNFEDCTVLTIAHRLQTIMDSDKVLVMQDGVAVEFDHPNILLEKKGVFYNLVMETGRSMGKNLVKVAQKSYDTNKAL